MSNEAPTDPPPPMVSPDTELIIAEIKKLSANVTLLGNAAKLQNESVGQLARDMKDAKADVKELAADMKIVKRELVGTREASESGIDIATEAKIEARTLRAIVEDTETIAGHADEKAGIAMDVWTQAAEPLGVRDIVDKVKQEHADAAKTRASSGPPRRR